MAVALVIATVLSPLAFSFIPILLLAWCLYLWWRPITAVFDLMTEYFTFFAVALLFTAPAGNFFAFLIALPVLVLINHGLEQVAPTLSYRETRYVRYPTTIGITLISILAAVLVVSLLLGSLSLLLASIALLVYFGLIGTVIVRRLPVEPVAMAPIQQRMVAGTEELLHVKLNKRTNVGGRLFLESPDEWVRVSPKMLSLGDKELVIGVSLSPTLSGPSLVGLEAYATDRWGLTQVRFTFEPVQLHVIPRAQYAAWLANKYLAETKVGALPLVSNVSEIKSVYGLRRGVEYYGNQLYQPGDSLKNIDWKHSIKYNELITKEFAEFHGQSAIILINLAVGNAEEADNLAYKTVVTAISLAAEGIPAALAAYNHEGVRLVTTVLQPQELVTRSLQVVREIVTVESRLKYLNPTDVTRLVANMSRLRSVESEASRVMLELLRLEYKNLASEARQNPASRALSAVFARVDKQANIVVISQRNHDAGAISFNMFSFARKGNAVITV
ncbi:MAG TPA: DUF58 domain-containing protein [Dehalococcoidia bacterium]|nr:DUF58 domain-containing protein [Dehalococcoidia bacterium]